MPQIKSELTLSRWTAFLMPTYFNIRMYGLPSAIVMH